MYEIKVDKNNKIIRIVFIGITTRDDVSSFRPEFTELLSKFRKKEYSVLASFEKMEPVPQAFTQDEMDMVELAISEADYIAAVFRKVVTRLQFQRIEDAIIARTGLQSNIQKFNNIYEAERYLLSKKGIRKELINQTK